MIRPSLVNLDTVCWVARLGSFTAAADRLHITQSTVSTRVIEVEQALGIKVFGRNGRKVDVTAEGMALVRQIEPLLQELDAVFGTVGKGATLPWTVRVGLGNLSMDWFPGLVKDLAAEAPNLNFDIETGLSSRLREALLANQLDLVIAPSEIRDDVLLCRPLGTMSLGWYAARSLLESRGIEGDDTARLFREVPVWTTARQSDWLGRSIRRLAESGLGKPAALNTCDDQFALRDLVIAGAGVGLLVDRLALPHVPAGDLVPLGGAGVLTVPFTIACRRDASTPVQDLMARAIVCEARYRLARRAADDVQPSTSAPLPSWLMA